MTAAAAVPVFVPDVPAVVLTAMALASAVQAVAIDTVSIAPELPVEPAAAVPVVSVLPALLVLHDAVVRSAAALQKPVLQVAVSAAEASLLHVILAAAQLSERRQSSLQYQKRPPEALQTETPASEPGIPAEVFHRSVP